MSAIPAAGPFREAVVDLSAIRDNIAALRTRIGTPYFLTVVKANAYGHGMIPVAQAALAGGATHLGVADVAEALALRVAGIGAPILAWLHDPNENFETAVAADVTVCVSSIEQLEVVVRAGHSVGVRPVVHIKLDTGLSRNGLAAHDWASLFARAAELEVQGDVTIEGIFSHLSNASAEDDLAQGARFDDGLALARAAGLTPAITHLSASVAALTLPQLNYNMVRVGLGTYGISPIDGFTPQEFGLRPAMTLRGRVAAVRDVPEGTGVSYNLTYRTPRASRLALVPIGYGEGIPRAASDRGPVEINGNRFTVAGRVAMDQFVVDCGAQPVAVGDEVVLFGDPANGHPTVQDWADATGTIGYEVVTRLGGRLVRTFIGA